MSRAVVRPRRPECRACGKSRRSPPEPRRDHPFTGNRSSLAFGDKTGLGHPSFVEPRQITFDFLLAVAVSVELYWLLIRVGEGDGADRGGNRTRRGAGHGLDANKMVRDRARIVVFRRVFSSSRILPFIERLD